mgnify:CR=1 FL=1
MGEASGDIVRTAGIEDSQDQAYTDQLMDLAKAVANATANLVLKAKAVSSQTKDEALQNKVITTATQCALATSQLVSCTKVRVPHVSRGCHLTASAIYRELSTLADSGLYYQ